MLDTVQLSFVGEFVVYVHFKCHDIFTEDAWEHAKLAIGRFASPEIGEYWGVNAEVIGGKLIVGNNLVIENATDKGVMQFKVDATGAWLNNSTMVFQQDGGGKILMDPKYGIVAGTSTLFGTNGTTVSPGFIDKDGRIILDEDGMPKDSNFFLDLRDGTAYFRGKVIAESGEFNGIVKAQDFLLPSGDSMVSILNSEGKIKGDWLELMGISIKNDVGDTVMTIDQTGVKFGTGFSPVTYQYSVNGTSWHDTMSANDKYRRESYDGGGTWAPGYQFKGTDGKNGANGSDASVTRANIVKAMLDAIDQDGLYTTTIDGKQCLGINATAIKTGVITSIDIYGGAFYDLDGKTKLVLNPSSTFNNYADLVLYGGGSGTRESFKISDEGSSIRLSAYGSEFLNSGSGTTNLKGVWDFRNATVRGVTAVFA